MKSNHVFYLLLVLSAISAFLLPQRATDKVRPMVGGLLRPVAGPTHSVTSWATGRGNGPPPPVDARPADTIVAENLELKHSLAKAMYDLNELRKVNAEREKLGEIRDLCTPVTVIGVEGGTRQILQLGSGTLAGLTKGMAVLHEQDIVGVLDAGPASAKVQLVTDPQSRVRGHFATFVRAPATPGSTEEPATQFTRLNLTPMLIEGAGNGKMVARNLSHAAATKAGLVEGVWVILDDGDWPKEVQGRRLGVVRKVGLGDKLMAEIEIRPEIELTKLQKVMVLTRSRQ